MRVWLFACALVAACSPSTSTTSTPGDDGGTSPPANADAGADQEKAYCDAAASHASCNDTGASTCDAQGKCLYGRLMTASAFAAYVACYSAPSCKSDDECIGRAGQTAGGAAATQYSNDCQTKIDSCSMSSDLELCSPAVYVYTGVAEAMNACLAKSCGELQACFDAATAPIKACKN